MGQTDKTDGQTTAINPLCFHCMGQGHKRIS